MTVIFNFHSCTIPDVTVVISPSNIEEMVEIQAGGIRHFDFS
jgi:hypothetical protein